MPKKKILIASGGYADIPMIKAAQKLGFFVITSGNDEKGLGIKYSDLYRKADNSNKEEILSIAEELEVDAICPGAAGRSAVTCSYAAERLGLEDLDSYENSKLLHDKDKFIKFARKNNLSIPESQMFNSVETAVNSTSQFDFPIIVKPVDSSGGRGIVTVKHKNEIKEAVIGAFNNSESKKIIVEEFIEGSNHGLSTIIRNRKVVFYFYDDEYYYLNPYMVAGAYAPGDVPEKTIEILISEIEKIASFLKLKDGVFHLQFVFKNDKPHIIDLCRRIPGDFYVDFVKYAAGIDYPVYILKAFAGLDISDLKQKSPEIKCMRHVVMCPNNGIFQNIYIDEIIKENIFCKFMILKNGTRITDFMRQKLGIIFLKFQTKKEMIDKSKKIHKLIRAKVEK